MRYTNATELEWERMNRLGNKIAAARKRGICTHGWLQGPPGPPDKLTTVCTCLDCGKTWPTTEEAMAANKEAIRNL